MATPQQPGPPQRVLARLSHALGEGVAAIPAQEAAAPADLAARFASILDAVQRRRVTTYALFETLRLETLDWSFDHGIEARVMDASASPVAADDGREEA